MKAFAKVLIALALIFSATVGTVSASQESLPGAALYPVKLQYEDARLALTQDLEAKALLAMAYAQERVDEAVQLAERGDEIPEPLAARYQLQVGLALQTMTGLGEAQQLQLREHFSGTLQNQVRVMAQVMARLHQGANAEHPEPTQAMIKTMQQAQEALGYAERYAGDNETPGNTAAPGPNPDAHGYGPDNGGANGGNGEGNGGANGGNGEGNAGGNSGNDDLGKNKHHGREDTGKPTDKGQNGDGGRPDEGGNPDNGNGGQGGNGDSDNGGSGNGNGGSGNGDGGSDNGGNGDGGSDQGGNGGQGGNGDGSGNGGNGGGGSGGGGGN